MSQREGTVVRFRNHWQDRPTGPRFAWCLGFTTELPLQRTVSRYQRALQELNCLDLVPMDSLQLTLLHLDVEEDLPAERVAMIGQAARKTLRGTGALRLTFGGPALVPDGVVLTVEPVAALATLRGALTEALAGTGVTGTPAPPLLPIAHANEAAMTAFVKATLGFLEPAPTTIRIPEVTLARFDGRYRSADWTPQDRVALD